MLTIKQHNNTRILRQGSAEGETRRNSDDRNAPVTYENQAITADHRAFKVIRNKCTSSPDEVKQWENVAIYTKNDYIVRQTITDVRHLAIHQNQMVQYSDMTLSLSRKLGSLCYELGGSSWPKKIQVKKYLTDPKVKYPFFVINLLLRRSIIALLILFTIKINFYI